MNNQSLDSVPAAIASGDGSAWAENLGRENQSTISAWGRATFDDNEDAMQIASRMNIEVAELLEKVAGNDPQLQAMIHTAQSVAEAINCRVNQLARGVGRCNPDEGAPAEAADVSIMLQQVADRLNVWLDNEVNAKMRINRARDWRKLSSGRFQHVTS